MLTVLQAEQATVYNKEQVEEIVTFLNAESDPEEEVYKLVAVGEDMAKVAYYSIYKGVETLEGYL